MTEVLEWVKCQACGRRFRWCAELAGTKKRCACGTLVRCPAIDGYEPPPAESSGVQDLSPDACQVVIEPVVAPCQRGEGIGSAVRERRGTIRLGPFGEAAVWLVGAAIGFALLVHAIITMFWFYIALAAVWTPFSFRRFWIKKRRWQGHRSLLCAFSEELQEAELS